MFMFFSVSLSQDIKYNSLCYTVGPCLSILYVIGCILEKAMAPHSSTLAWKIPWMEEPGGLQSMGSLRVGLIERLHFHFSLSCIGEGNGNPLQCSCLENSRDGGSLVGCHLWGCTESDMTEAT